MAMSRAIPHAIRRHTPFFVRLSSFLIGSAAAQGMASLTGLLLAHWLPKHDYAIYTIMTVIMGAMMVLTKGGVNLGYAALVGRDWPDVNKVDAASKLVARVRRMMSALMLPPICIVSGLLLFQNGAQPVQIAALLGLLLLSWFFDMQTRVVDLVLYYAKQTTRVQMLDTGLNGVRLVGTAALHAVNALGVVASVMVSVLISAMRVVPIKRWIARLVPPSAANQPPETDYMLVRSTALRQVPTEIFSVFQTQIMLFILSFFAGSGSVADYGALTRIGQLLGPVQTMSYAFLIPVFAGYKDHIVRHFVRISLLCAIPALLLVVASWLVPDLVLLLIGAKYASLQGPLLIAMINAALYSSLAISWNLLAHRGFNHFAWLQIPVGLGWCLVAPLFLNISRLSDALWLQAGFSLGYLVSIIADIIAAKRRGDI